MNKRINARIFFAVLGKGICNAFGWLFGYKNKSGFWRVISAVFTACLTVFAVILLIVVGGEFGWWHYHRWDYYKEQLGSNLVYKYDYYHGGSVGKICNRFGRTLLSDIDWVRHETGDSIAVYANKGRRGFINVKTGKVIIPASKYCKAYVFSEGRALVMDQDSLYIIDTDGQQVGNGFVITSARSTMVNCFHGGYMPMVGENGKMGLINKNAEWILRPEYDYLGYAMNKFWIARTEAVIADGDYSSGKSAQTVIYDDSLRVMMQGNWVDVTMSQQNEIIVEGEDHWQRRYGFDGKMKDNFVCDRIDYLTYQTGEKKWITMQKKGYYDDDVTISTEEQDVEANATLMKYVTSTGWEGLMTTDGKPVTPPLYKYISAVGKNLYFCSKDNYNEYGILLDSNGRKVE